MKDNRNAGQTIIALLIFMLLAMTLCLSATMIVVIQAQGDAAAQNSEQALQYAQAGIENALVRLERNATYTGETLTLGSGTATISVSGSSTVTIVSVGAVQSIKRTLTTTVTNTNSVISLNSWSETP
jgi:type II secretory pathway component PulK